MGKAGVRAINTARGAKTRFIDSDGIRREMDKNEFDDRVESGALKNYTVVGHTANPGVNLREPWKTVNGVSGEKLWNDTYAPGSINNPVNLKTRRDEYQKSLRPTGVKGDETTSSVKRKSLLGE